jgi:hypothetical protein
MISAQALAPEGRKVKCSKCAEVWHQIPDPDELIENLEKSIEEIPESVKPIPEGSSVPAVREDDEQDTAKDKISGTTKAISLAASAFVFILIYILLMLVKTPLTQSWPASITLYKTLGMSVQTPGQGVEFDRIYAEISKDGHITVEGFVLNLTSNKQTIPTIEASLKDTNGEDLAVWQIPAPQATIDAEDSIAFDAAYKEKVKGAESLKLRFTLGDATIESPIDAAQDAEHQAPEHHEPANKAPHADAHAPAHDADHH